MRPLTGNLDLQVSAGLALTAVAAGGMYAASEYAGTHDEQHNRDVAACSSKLGEQAILAATIPNACEAFKTSFEFHGTIVNVRMPQQAGNNEPQLVKGFSLPPAQSFEERETLPTRGSESNEFNLKATALLVGFLGTLASVLPTAGKRRRQGVAQAAQEV